MPQTNKLSPVGERIDGVRQKRGVTLYRVAKDANMDYSQFHRIMRGKSRPSRDSLLRICKSLRCNVQEAAEIFSETDYRSPSADELEDASALSKLIA